MAQPYMKLFEKAPESLHLWNTADWAFLNRYLIERTLMSPPTVFELSPALISKNTPLEISILSKTKANNYWHKIKWFKVFFKKYAPQQVIKNIPYADKDLLILERYSIQQVNDRKLFLKNMRANNILFHIGNIHQFEEKYYIPIIYWQQDKNTVPYSTPRIYEFEICASGVFNFLGYYTPVGCCGLDGGEMFSHTRIAEFECKDFNY